MTRDEFVAQVKDVIEEGSGGLSLSDYIDAMEELVDECYTRKEAAEVDRDTTG